MRMRTLLRPLERFLARFGAGTSGIAAMEFALIAPVMLVMYWGVTELSDALMANAKTTAVASTAADLIAQDNSVSNSDISDVFAALNAVMFPYPSGNLKVVISSLVDAGNNQVKVAWSDQQNSTARTVGTYVTIPTGLVTSGGGGSVILAEVTYAYSSPVGKLIYGGMNLTARFYLRPRRVAQVPRTS
jgi:Flp pilus assembly protein TadG